MTPTTGHNSGAVQEAPTKNQLKSLVERIESVETDMRERAEDRKEIYQEAKSAGFDVPSLRAIVRMRREDATKRAEREALVELYKDTLGIA